VVDELPEAASVHVGMPCVADNGPCCRAFSEPTRCVRAALAKPNLAANDGAFVALTITRR